MPDRRDKKKPRFKGNVPTHKRPLTGTPVQNKQARFAPMDDATMPAWHFGCIDWSGPFGWEEISRESMQGVIEVLKTLEVMTWSEIKYRDNGKRNHPVSVESICREAQKRLEAIEQETDDLFCIRVTHVARLWGIADRNVLKILWWDPEHSVYPMNVTGN